MKQIQTMKDTLLCVHNVVKNHDLEFGTELHGAVWEFTSQKYTKVRVARAA